MAQKFTVEQVGNHIASLGTPPAVPEVVQATDVCAWYAKVRPFLSLLAWVPTVGAWITYGEKLMDQFCPTATPKQGK
jgi:hypothetical protein